MKWPLHLSQAIAVVAAVFGLVTCHYIDTTADVEKARIEALKDTPDVEVVK